MRMLKVLLLVLTLGAIPLVAFARPQAEASTGASARVLTGAGNDQQPATMDQVVDRIVTQEQAEMQSLRPYSPLVETYIQNMRADKALGTVPAGDKYFLGRAVLAKGVDLEPLTDDPGSIKRKVLSNMGSVFSLSMEYLPRGFLQMIYVDTDGFDREHYNFDYVRREFLGEIRCLVFDVTPQQKAGKGRFLGRIWVEDQDFHIVRFNGAYTGSSKTSYYFHFDSWRVNAGPNQWLPAFIYSEEGQVRYAVTKTLMFKAQTRLWGYNIGHANEEQELSKILVEAPTPVKDQTGTANDLSPLQAQRTWDLQAEDNVVDRMERLGLLAPRGDVDKVLETVINNLEVTNDLDIQPEIRCRVLMTSTLEAFDIGHTIVVSRGMIDVLPDEASLAAILAHELGHVVLAHRIDTQYAFFDRMLFDEKDTFRHFGFARTADEEQEANKKGVELLRNSPYKDQLATPELFLQALENRSKEIPGLISPHLGDRVPTSLAMASAAPGAQSGSEKPEPDIIALPLGGRIKIDPWSDRLDMIKAKPVGVMAEREKMPFEVTPFVLYLSREQSDTPAPGAVSAEAKPDASDPIDPSRKPE